jgi:hypothetical protein
MAVPQPIDPWQLDEQQFPVNAAAEAQFRFLLQYAILAPSFQNMQPWKFQIRADGIDVFADRMRWLKVADPDQRELLISIGCALENLLIAAEHFGIGHELVYYPDQGFLDHVATLRLAASGSVSFFRPKSLFDAIPIRHTSHKKHGDRKISDRHFDLLKSCLIEPDIHLHLSADTAIQREVDDLLVRGNVLQFADGAYRQEVAQLIGQGALGTSWLISKLGELAHSHMNRGKAESQRDSELLMSSPAIGVICSGTNDRTAHVKSGQVYQRIGLLAASMAIWLQPMSHIVEVPELREELAQLIPIPDAIPQHPFRLGFGEPEAKHTPRRPLSDLLVDL